MTPIPPVAAPCCASSADQGRVAFRSQALDRAQLGCATILIDSRGCRSPSSHRVRASCTRRARHRAPVSARFRPDFSPTPRFVPPRF